MNPLRSIKQVVVFAMVIALWMTVPRGRMVRPRA